MADRICEKCKHSFNADQGTVLKCGWERSFLPPPVHRERNWGNAAPSTHSEWAKDCQHYDEANHMTTRAQQEEAGE